MHSPAPGHNTRAHPRYPPPQTAQTHARLPPPIARALGQRPVGDSLPPPPHRRRRRPSRRRRLRPPRPPHPQRSLHLCSTCCSPLMRRLPLLRLSGCARRPRAMRRCRQRWAQTPASPPTCAPCWPVAAPAAAAPPPSGCRCTQPTWFQCWLASRQPSTPPCWTSACCPPWWRRPAARLRRRAGAPAAGAWPAARCGQLPS